MIVKFIAENDAEKSRLGGKDKLEHYGVKEYFVVGNKTDSEGAVYDFHDWHGAFKFLLSELSYYYEIVNDERRAAERSDSEEAPIRDFARKQRMIKKGDIGKIHPIDLSNIVEESKKISLALTVGDEAALDAEDEDQIQKIPKFQIMTGNVENDTQEDTQVDTTVAQVNKDTFGGKKGLRIIPPTKE